MSDRYFSTYKFLSDNPNFRTYIEKGAKEGKQIEEHRRDGQGDWIDSYEGAPFYWHNYIYRFKVVPVKSDRERVKELEAAFDHAASELKKAEEKLAFLKSKGISVGMMKTTDKPDPYMVYVIEPDSELCDLRTINRLIDSEIENRRLKEKIERLENPVLT